MGLPLLLIVIGIAVAVLVHWGLGVLLIIVGLVLLALPYIKSRGGTARGGTTPRETSSRAYAAERTARLPAVRPFGGVASNVCSMPPRLSSHPVDVGIRSEGAILGGAF